MRRIFGKITARYRPREYAASDTDDLKGLQSEARWDHFWGRHFISDFSGSDTHIYTQPGAQTVQTAIANLRCKAFNGMSLGSGVSVSEFSNDHKLVGLRHSLNEGTTRFNPGGPGQKTVAISCLYAGSLARQTCQLNDDT